MTNGGLDFILTGVLLAANYFHGISEWFGYMVVYGNIQFIKSARSLV